MHVRYLRWKFGLWRRLGVPSPNHLPYVGTIREIKKLGLHDLDMKLVNTYGKIVGTNRKSEMDIAGYKIPKDADLSIAIYAVHRDPEHWPDPDKFDPERFSPENKANRHPFAYFPFGHGPRNCIGQRLAAMEAKCAIAYILQHYRFATCDETEIPLQLDKKGL